MTYSEPWKKPSCSQWPQLQASLHSCLLQPLFCQIRVLSHLLGFVFQEHLPSWGVKHPLGNGLMSGGSLHVAPARDSLWPSTGQEAFGSTCHCESCQLTPAPDRVSEEVCRPLEMNLLRTGKINVSNPFVVRKKGWPLVAKALIVCRNRAGDSSFSLS